MADYPRIANYGAVNSNLEPFSTDLGATFTPAALDAQAYWNETILDGGPLIYKPSLVAALRARNPKLKLYAYNLCDTFFASPNPVTQSVAYAIYTACQAIPQGVLPGVPFQWNFTRQDVALAIADGFISTVGAHPELFDGLFLDVVTYSITYAYNPGTGLFGINNSFFDPASVGMTAQQAMDAWKANHNLLFSTLRSKLPATWLIMANSAIILDSTGAYPNLNGGMREIWPNIYGPGTWESNMIGYSDVAGFNPGYLLENWRQPHASWNAALPSTYNGSAQRQRYGLASACLDDGMWSWGRLESVEAGGGYQFSQRAWMTYRYPESDDNGAGQNWLGLPVTNFLQNDDGTFSRKFEQGYVYVNPLGNTIQRIEVPEHCRNVTTGAQGNRFDVPPADGLFLRFHSARRAHSHR